MLRGRSQRPDSSFDGSASAAEVAYRQVAGEDGDATVDTKGGEAAASPCFLKDDVSDVGCGWQLESSSGGRYNPPTAAKTLV